MEGAKDGWAVLYVSTRDQWYAEGLWYAEGQWGVLRGLPLDQWYGEDVWGLLYEEGLWGVLPVLRLDDYYAVGPTDVTCVKRTCVACGLPLDQWYEEGQWDLL